MLPPLGLPSAAGESNLLIPLPGRTIGPLQLFEAPLWKFSSSVPFELKNTARLPLSGLPRTAGWDPIGGDWTMVPAAARAAGAMDTPNSATAATRIRRHREPVN